MKEISPLLCNSVLTFPKQKEYSSKKKMSRITSLKPEEVIRKLKKLGFVGTIPGGKHTRMVHIEKQIIILFLVLGRYILLGRDKF